MPALNKVASMDAKVAACPPVQLVVVNGNSVKFII